MEILDKYLKRNINHKTELINEPKTNLELRLLYRRYDKGFKRRYLPNN